jgi:hypothetical protein
MQRLWRYLAFEEGLFEGMESDNPQVRDIYEKALEIHTGQRKDFNPNEPENDRAAKVKEWQL